MRYTFVMNPPVVKRFTLASVFGAALIVACSSSSTPSAPASTSGGTSGGTDGAAAEPDASSTAADGSTSGDLDSATGADSAAPFALTSSTIAEGGSFPPGNTCSGANTSPPLAWTAGPAGTKSYAIVLNDTTISFLHFIVYDIPASVFALPAALEAAYAPANPAGAHETKSYQGTFGYSGPCPPALHVYEFVLYALDVATLPGVMQDVSLADAQTAIKAHSLGSTKLTAMYMK